VFIDLISNKILGMNIDSPPSLPRKERVILELLVSAGPLYGLQLVKFSDGALKRGTVYATLARMEAKGYVESEQEELPAGAIGLPRRIYRPTPLGKRVRRAWVALAREFALEVPR
jgi:DNA-binding PadR family transcriptional regulator